MEVIIGGTFGHVHKGHIKLLKKAFEIGDHVYIGLTTDEYVRKNKPGQNVAGYEERKRKLEEIVTQLKKEYEIKPLNDKFGPSITGKFDVIVVSEETYHTALDINAIRERKGLKPLRIIKIGYVYAKDSRPISSTRIRNGEIDESGNLKHKVKK
jgi:cytidyltransferase-like protein